MTTTYKALSFYQPYAWMIVNGYIDIDDRHQNFKYRGPMLIHASKSVHIQYYMFVRHVLGINIPELDALEKGGIVGQVNLVDCIPPGAPTSVPFERRAHGGIDCYGLVLENVVKFKFVPARGKQGLFDIEIDSNKLVPIYDNNVTQSSLF